MSEPIRPVAWYFQSGLRRKVQLLRPVGGDEVLRHWQRLYPVPADSLVLPAELAQVVLELARERLQYQVCPEPEQLGAVRVLARLLADWLEGRSE
ncbi:hypothetical protein [Pseudomonas schmalbachii]|uniref:Uncharacterized protein n=1 Tax=Pseudomonas schmalbachii TaxID=2816993 RepID=A0ABS3TKG4_9PSED|nr:hypothetical protein [Pseudomonas schmalbachii]MBO3274145.1 hypothetical protein [Pseudomonas schmalbachii]